MLGSGDARFTSSFPFVSHRATGTHLIEANRLSNGAASLEVPASAAMQGPREERHASMHGLPNAIRARIGAWCRAVCAAPSHAGR